MGVLAYLRVRVGLLLRSRIVVGAAVLLVSACSLSSLVPLETSFGPGLYHARREALGLAMERGEVRAEDDEQADLFLAYDAALVSLEQDRPGLTGNWHAFLGNATRAAETALRMAEVGLCPFGVGGVGSESSVRAELALASALHEGGWTVFGSTASQPALLRLAAVPSLLPGAMWCLPTLVIVCALGLDRSGGRLLAQAPVGLRSAAFMDTGLAWAFGMLLVVLAWGVAALVALRNGVGDLGYPVVRVAAEGPSIITVGSAILGTMVTLAISTLVMALFAVAVSMGERPWLPALVAGVLLLLGAALAEASGGKALSPLRAMDPLSMAPVACYPGDAGWGLLVGNPGDATPLVLVALGAFALVVLLFPHMRSRGM